MSTVSLAFPDPEGTRVCQVCLVVRVYLDSLVLQSRVKDSLEILDFPGGLEAQGFLDQRGRLGSWGSPGQPDHGVTTVHQVLTGTPEKLVDLEAKVCLETRMDTLEVLELKVSLEFRGSQVAEPSMVFPETTDIQEFQVSLEQRGPLENQDVLG